MTGRLKGKVALITGGTSGIGAASVEVFIEAGAKVMLAGRNSERGQAIAQRLGPSARFVRTDVSREADIAGAIEETV